MGHVESPVPSAVVDTQERRTAGHARRPWVSLRATFVISSLVTAVVVLVLTVIPMPYVVERPGPTLDVGARVGTMPVIEISGTDPDTGQSVYTDPLHEPGDEAGELRMVTISEQGGPDSRLSLMDLALAWFDPKVKIIPYSQVYAPTTTREQVSQAAQAQMKSSQNAAAVVALEELGWKVPATMTVAGPVPGTDAEGKVHEGDVLRSIRTPDGTVHMVDSAEVPFALMRTVPVDTPLTVTVLRNGKETPVQLTSSPGAPKEKGSKMGIYLTAEVKLPLHIGVTAQNIGGPSAGMMFALGIMDRLTPGDMTGGQSIAGTGTLSFDGKVGPIGGIQQKMWGAVRDGSHWFLAPTSNCDEVHGHVPHGLRVVKVDDIKATRDAVTRIAEGRGQSLPTCEAADAEAAKQAQSGQ
ncbi:PDZ domain-containing protein [Schaalia sp. 19OD2882]|uniref:YlbL family protein n=1 Tax=Schaalia sp. 19OD2882 TaxID=2794089 RepID=UPI0020A83643|nr:S16 family serine protease [Schaalia sp. 19OD2882]